LPKGYSNTVVNVFNARSWVPETCPVSWVVALVPECARDILKAAPSPSPGVENFLDLIFGDAASSKASSDGVTG